MKIDEDIPLQKNELFCKKKGDNLLLNGRFEHDADGISQWYLHLHKPYSMHYVLVLICKRIGQKLIDIGMDQKKPDPVGTRSCYRRNEYQDEC